MEDKVSPMTIPGATTVTPSLALPGALWAHAQTLAQELNLSPDQLMALALTRFIQQHASAWPVGDVAPQGGGEQRVINQGDVYWVQLPNPNERQPGLSHPYVVIQDNLFNHSRIETVVACALTSNLARISNTPGNVLLEAVAMSTSPRPKPNVLLITTDHWPPPPLDASGKPVGAPG